MVETAKFYETWNEGFNDVAYNLAENSSELVKHKFGEEAGKVVHDGLMTLGDVNCVKNSYYCLSSKNLLREGGKSMIKGNPNS